MICSSRENMHGQRKADSGEGGGDDRVIIWAACSGLDALATLFASTICIEVPGDDTIAALST
jgi:hypothetical protein